MEILKPSFVIEDEIDGEQILKNLERYSRTCYKSEDKITPDSARKFVAKILKSGHESVIEHEKVTVRVICDRGVTHEIVRHRIASYSQESTRYCNYKLRGVQVIEPLFFAQDSARKRINIPAGWQIANSGDRKPYIMWNNAEINEFDIWFMTMLFAEWAYITLVRDFNKSPQEARSVLPHSLKTEILITYNLREWRHFFRVRCSKRAHPQMREIVVPLLQEFKHRIPIIFDDIAEE
jgi:thymidylate synthase (FAD)